MKQETIDQLETVFTSEKIFVNDGYYRIRSLSSKKKELAFLVVDPCGSSVVHPQITIEKRANDWVATKLLDLQETPLQRFDRTEATSQQLDQALQLLVHKFQSARPSVKR